MPKGKGTKHMRDRARHSTSTGGGAVSKYREAWADGAYNRDNSEDEDDQHEGPQPVRISLLEFAYSVPSQFSCICLQLIVC